MTLSKLTQLSYVKGNWLLSWASGEDPTHAERYSCQSVSLTQPCSDACGGAQRAARWTKDTQKYLYGLKKNSNRKKKFKIVHL